MLRSELPDGAHDFARQPPTALYPFFDLRV
jgi:hypothetical protein